MTNTRKCYYQGCKEAPTTREHLPPKAFFPAQQREQLITVPSCKAHNNDKSGDDIYALAQICVSASPHLGANEVFKKSVLPQLEHNNESLRRTIVSGATGLPNGSVKYPVDIARFNRFFDALSFGIIFKVCGTSLPDDYRTEHAYHNLVVEGESHFATRFRDTIGLRYRGSPQGSLVFGDPNTINRGTYQATVFGVPQFRSSITVVHLFYDSFRVTSMVSVDWTKRSRQWIRERLRTLSRSRNRH